MILPPNEPAEIQLVGVVLVGGRSSILNEDLLVPMSLLQVGNDMVQAEVVEGVQRTEWPPFVSDHAMAVQFLLDLISGLRQPSYIRKHIIVVQVHHLGVVLHVGLVALQVLRASVDQLAVGRVEVSRVHRVQNVLSTLNTRSDELLAHDSQGLASALVEVHVGGEA